MDHRADSDSSGAEQESEAQALAWTRGMRSQSLGNLAHELRTPIQVLIGYLDLLREELSSTVPPETLEILERMNRNVYELAQTIDNLMEHALSKADAAAPKAEEELAPRGLLAEIMPVLESANATKHLALSFDLATAAETIRAPRGALRSILLNLALNAIKFTDSGSVVIALRRVVTGGAEEHEIEVSDTGPGLSQAMFEQALKPFAQLSGGSDRRYRGLGLGLSVTQRNVTAIGGRLELSSNSGVGAKFIVSFPARPRPQPPLPITRRSRGQLPVTTPLPSQPSAAKRLPGTR